MRLRSVINPGRPEPYPAVVIDGLEVTVYYDISERGTVILKRIEAEDITSDILRAIKVGDLRPAIHAMLLNDPSGWVGWRSCTNTRIPKARMMQGSSKSHTGLRKMPSRPFVTGPLIAGVRRTTTITTGKSPRSTSSCGPNMARRRPRHLRKNVVRTSQRSTDGYVRAREEGWLTA